MWREFAVDLLSYALTAWSAAGMWLSAWLTVAWDPLGWSRRPIPIHGRCLFREFQVVHGAFPSAAHDHSAEVERRVAAWFYRWHDTPNTADWMACIARFGLDRVPEHRLRMMVGGEVTTTMVLVREISYDAGSRESRQCTALIDCGYDLDAAPTVQIHASSTRSIGLGSLSPNRLVADLYRIRKQI